MKKKIIKWSQFSVVPMFLGDLKKRFLGALNTIFDAKLV